ncbi:hypothetical protein GUITHDRAFT_145647 [Guillardia theta CCMP2712]|uniref:Eukaryotic translation initiation factor 4E n=1 Tax=Guillardia theta (strain CCMP2712) TaxID=905079 RepID=L1IK18_GUITC|nr:hypothetical protein GUITHDRAFT_145647 [Guillardia theta CCMP2712]EKX36593.1 hypothetical protein GUITHDRAFT_145647 [Guillardia theta CCMP2712]|eukprot:XP_005823573.1 hypothetical protein GUITHDRAFT_145647 [Guillardia theta CCMP2712]
MQLLIPFPLLRVPSSLWFYFIANNDEEDSQSSERAESELYSTPSFNTVEEFWSIYDHLVRPNEMSTNFDCCLFRDGIKPFPDDPANMGGGKWTLRLRKGLASRFWEEVILACIGGAHNMSQDFCGAIVTSRPEEDVLSVWCDHR